MRKRYRYISCGTAKNTDKISDFRLISGNQLKQTDGRLSSVIRVQIPSNMVLTKYSCDSYSTTDNTRTLEELGCDIMVRINGNFVIRNDLKHLQLCDISEELHKKEQLYITAKGYMDKKHYREYLNAIDEANKDRRHRAKELKIQLDNNPIAYVDNLKYQDADVLVEMLKLYVNEKYGREII